MISIDRGLELVLDAARQAHPSGSLGIEEVPLGSCRSRILAASITSDADSPRFDKSIRDGFAVRSQDVKDTPTVLEIVGEARAGFGSDVPLQSGQTVEIMTGAPMPAGADAVVMVEYTERLSDSRVRILKAAAAGTGLLKQGAEARAGDLLLAPGREIGVADIGLLASVGCARVPVAVRPRVAVLATGDELVGVDEFPGVGSIRNSNSWTLSAQVAQSGGAVVDLGLARDDQQELKAKIVEGLQCDVLLVSGGVSMGKYDLVEDIFRETGVEVLFDRVAMKPGKPTVFGRRERTLVFGLPGNPLSTVVSFAMFVRPALRYLLGSPDFRVPPDRARLEGAMKCDPERTGLLPARSRSSMETVVIEPVAWKGSSDLVALSRANALIVVPQREGVLNSGDIVEFFRLDG